MRLAILLPMFLAACVQQQPGVPSHPGSSSHSCATVQASDWAAWVNAMPGPNATPKLIVTGKATVPTGGYSFSWGEPIVMESYPVQVQVELRPTGPGEMATQAVVTHDIRGEWPMRDPVGAVTITCGTRTLARISPVETAH